MTDEKIVIAFRNVYLERETDNLKEKRGSLILTSHGRILFKSEDGGEMACNRQGAVFRKHPTRLLIQVRWKETGVLQKWRFDESVVMPGVWMVPETPTTGAKVLQIFYSFLQNKLDTVTESQGATGSSQDDIKDKTPTSSPVKSDTPLLKDFITNLQKNTNRIEILGREKALEQDQSLKQVYLLTTEGNFVKEDEFWNQYKLALTETKEQLIGKSNVDGFVLSKPVSGLGRITAASNKNASGADVKDTSMDDEDKLILNSLLQEFPKLKKHFDQRVPSVMDEEEFYSRLTHSAFYAQLNNLDVPEVIWRNDDGFQLDFYEDLERIWGYWRSQKTKYSSPTEGEDDKSKHPSMTIKDILPLIDGDLNMLLNEEGRPGHGTCLGGNSFAQTEESALLRNSLHSDRLYDDEIQMRITSQKKLDIIFDRFNRHSAEVLASSITNKINDNNDGTDELLDLMLHRDMGEGTLDKLVAHQRFSQNNLQTVRERERNIKEHMKNWRSLDDLNSGTMIGSLEIDKNKFLIHNRNTRDVAKDPSRAGQMLEMLVNDGTAKLKVTPIPKGEIDKFYTESRRGASGIFERLGARTQGSIGLERAVRGSKVAPIGARKVHTSGVLLCQKKVVNETRECKRQDILEGIMSNHESCHELLDAFAVLQKKVTNVLQYIWRLKINTINNEDQRRWLDIIDKLLEEVRAGKDHHETTIKTQGLSSQAAALLNYGTLSGPLIESLQQGRRALSHQLCQN